jgi:hypothetical protein
MSTNTAGFSPTAQFIDSYRHREQFRWRETDSFGVDHFLLEDLYDVWEECRVRNWDGHQAVPVSRDSLRHTYQLLEVLPSGLPTPSLCAEPCGEVTLEWYASPRRLLSVSVSADGELHYAALLGRKRQYGTEVFQGEFPATLAQIVREVFRQEVPRR